MRDQYAFSFPRQIVTRYDLSERYVNLSRVLVKHDRTISRYLDIEMHDDLRASHSYAGAKRTVTAFLRNQSNLAVVRSFNW